MSSFSHSSCGFCDSCSRVFGEGDDCLFEAFCRACNGDVMPDHRYSLLHSALSRAFPYQAKLVQRYSAKELQCVASKDACVRRPLEVVLLPKSFHAVGTCGWPHKSSVNRKDLDVSECAADEAPLIKFKRSESKHARPSYFVLSSEVSHSIPLHSRVHHTCTQCGPERDLLCILTSFEHFLMDAETCMGVLRQEDWRCNLDRSEDGIDEEKMLTTVGSKPPIIVGEEDFDHSPSCRSGSEDSSFVLAKGRAVVDVTVALAEYLRGALLLGECCLSAGEDARESLRCAPCKKDPSQCVPNGTEDAYAVSEEVDQLRGMLLSFIVTRVTTMAERPLPMKGMGDCTLPLWLLLLATTGVLQSTVNQRVRFGAGGEAATPGISIAFLVHALDRLARAQVNNVSSVGTGLIGSAACLAAFAGIPLSVPVTLSRNCPAPLSKRDDTSGAPNITHGGEEGSCTHFSRCLPALPLGVMDREHTGDGLPIITSNIPLCGSSSFAECLSRMQPAPLASGCGSLDAYTNNVVNSFMKCMRNMRTGVENATCTSDGAAQTGISRTTHTNDLIDSSVLMDYEDPVPPVQNPTHITGKPAGDFTAGEPGQASFSRQEAGEVNATNARMFSMLEGDVAAASNALTFATKLGSLYVTQDINTLLSLLSTAAEETTGGKYAFSPTLGSATERIPTTTPRCGIATTSAEAYRSHNGCKYWNGRMTHVWQHDRRDKRIDGVMVQRMVELCRSPLYMPLTNQTLARELSLNLVLMLLNELADCVEELPHGAAMATPRTTSSTQAPACKQRWLQLCGYPPHVWPLVAASVCDILTSVAMVSLHNRRVSLSRGLIQCMCVLQHSCEELDQKLFGGSLVFCQLWFLHFQSVADTAMHLLSSGHSSPQALESVAWLLAGLAEYLTSVAGRGALRSAQDEVDASPTPVYIIGILDCADVFLKGIVRFMHVLASVTFGKCVSAACDDAAVYENPRWHTSSAMTFETFLALSLAEWEAEDESTMWSMLCVHYFLEILDVLLDAASWLPNKSLTICSLLVAVTQVDTTAKCTGVTPIINPVSTPLSSDAAHTGVSRGNAEPAPGQLQLFLSWHCRAVLQHAVNCFSFNGDYPAWGTRLRECSGRTDGEAGPEAQQGSSDDILCPLFLLSPAFTLSNTSNGSAAQVGDDHSSVPAPYGKASSQGGAESPPFTSLSTMWWPHQRFQHRLHLLRVIVHAHAVANFFCSREVGAASAPPAAAVRPVSECACPPAAQISPRIQNSLHFTSVTPLITTASGVCAQLLSFPCPKPSFQERLVRKEQKGSTSGTDLQSAHAPTGTTPVSSLVVDGLWLRIQLLRLVAVSAGPLDQSLMHRYAESLKVSKPRVNADTENKHSTTCSAFQSVSSVMPGLFSPTYVRLLFLRIVQAFSVDRRDSGARSHHTDVSAVAMTTAAVAKPLAQLLRAATDLWSQYMYELLHTMGELCWFQEDAYITATRLAVPSVLAHFLSDIMEAEKVYAADCPSSPVYDTPTVVACGADGFLSASVGQTDGLLAPLEVKYPNLSTDMPEIPNDFLDFDEQPADEGTADICRVFSESEVIREECPPPGSNEDEAVQDDSAFMLEVNETTERQRMCVLSLIPQSQSTLLGGSTSDTEPQQAVPKISLAGLGPALYFASSGDTAAAQESTLLLNHQVGFGKTSDLLFCRTSTEESIREGGASEVDCKVLSPMSMMEPSSPVHLYPTGVDAQLSEPTSFVLPKLTLGTLPPPIYYVSNGDTGMLDEITQDVQKQQFKQPKKEVGIGAPHCASYSDRPDRPLPGPAPTATALSGTRQDPTRCLTPMCTDDDGSIDSSATPHSVKRFPRSIMSMNRQAPAAVTKGVAALPLSQIHSQPKEHSISDTSQRLRVTSAPHPRITAELLLCLTFLMLQRGSGMLQNNYTECSLVQRRLPHSYGVTQPRILDVRSLHGRQLEDGAPRVRLDWTYDAGGISSLPSDMHGRHAVHVLHVVQLYLQHRRSRPVATIIDKWLADRLWAVEDDFMQAHTDTTAATTRDVPWNPLAYGLYVLLRLLLPRRVWLRRLRILRRLGCGGCGAVMSATYLGDGNRQQEPGAATGTGDFISSSAVPADRVDRLEAAHLQGRCHVALKLMPLQVQGSESGALPTCHREVLAMCRLRGLPHICGLLSFGFTGDEYFIVMPQYEGGSMYDWRLKEYPPGCVALTQSMLVVGSTPGSSAVISRNRFSLFSICSELFTQALEAVSQLHARNIRHGDIKASNFFIESLVRVQACSVSHDHVDPNVDDSLTQSEAGERWYALPQSLCLGDFGVCDTCEDDDLHQLLRELEGGEARFLSSRWGCGKGTEAIQPPELMFPRRRYAIYRAILQGAEQAQEGSCPASEGAVARDFEGLKRRESVVATVRQAELSVDMWACGCLLYEMLTGRMLFGEARLGRLVALATDGSKSVSKSPTISGNRVTTLDEWERRDLVKAVGGDVVKFLSDLLSLEPLARPTANEALLEWKMILARRSGL